MAERRRPLVRPAQIEQLLAALDDRAVGVADRNRGYLAGRDGDHGLVEQTHAGSDLPEVDQAPTLANPGEGNQFQVAKAFADLRGLAEWATCARRLALKHARSATR